MNTAGAQWPQAPGWAPGSDLVLEVTRMTPRDTFRKWGLSVGLVKADQKGWETRLQARARKVVVPGAWGG